jgi:hypothetical protein
MIYYAATPGRKTIPGVLIRVFVYWGWIAFVVQWGAIGMHVVSGIEVWSFRGSPWSGAKDGIDCHILVLWSDAVA